MLTYKIRYVGEIEEGCLHKDTWAVFVHVDGAERHLIYRTLEQIQDPQWNTSSVFKGSEAREFRDLLAIARDELKDMGLLPH